ncbi:MAG TPA: hypothetical protein VNX02_07970 [Steroidobacteraceae bacterium]|jgi:hypothetical protein|nr:hypothetical protein [Steroidobacteraceae bacterium]
MKATLTLLFAVAMIGLAPWSLAQSEPRTEMRSPPSADAVPAADVANAPRSAITDEVAANTRVASLVPAGMSTKDACIGFQNMAECSAALHAAANLNVPFGDLKSRMIGGMTLLATIHALKPKADARREAQRAEQQANADLRASG